MPPPTAWRWPPVIVSPEIDAVTLGLIRNTRLSPPPLTVTPAAGPVIVSVPCVSLSVELALPVRVIVWAVAKTVGSKVIVLATVTHSPWRWPGADRVSPATGVSVALFTIERAVSSSG